MQIGRYRYCNVLWHRNCIGIYVGFVLAYVVVEFFGSLPSLSPPLSSKVVSVPEKQVLAVVDVQKAEKPKLILTWNKIWWGFADKKTYMTTCLELKCEMTQNRSLVNEDAVVFHMPYLNPDAAGKDFPTIRHRWQRYVFLTIEPPTLYPLSVVPPNSISAPNSRVFDNIFNWTMTYRSDSDIPFPYGAVLPLASRLPSYQPSPNSRKKTRLAAWFSTRCLSPSKREDIIQEMISLNATVDIYGTCGKLRCNKNEAYGDSHCQQMLEETYFFYMAFENSICPEYITEKVFNMLQYDIVPVVLKRAVADKVAPNGSFIAVDDFETVLQLVDYLKYLAGNRTAYESYFSWKSRFSAETWIHMMWNSAPEIGFCALCKALHNSEYKEKTYPNFYDWYVTKGQCEHRWPNGIIPS